MLEGFRLSRSGTRTVTEVPFPPERIEASPPRRAARRCMLARPSPSAGRAGGNPLPLSLTASTVNFHLQRIYEKLRVHSKTEAVAKALRNRLI